MVTMLDSESAVTPEQIEQLEEELRVKLPTEYRYFLLQYDGGRPDPDGIIVAGFDETDVQVLFGINRKNDSSLIIWNMATLSDRLPAGLVPVGTDSGGNVFCISTRVEDYGSVLYADLDEIYGAPGQPRIYSVAQSFEEFLRKLTL